MKVPDEWHRSFFRNVFYNPASPAAAARAPEEARFVLRGTGLKKGGRLLDLCCGPGRHCVPLAARGLEVTGLDYSRDYLKEAEAAARRAKVKIRFLRGDMRRLGFRGEFDAVINMFTSFGYFRKFSDDLRTLKGAARALRPGGVLMMDIINGDYIRKNFRERGWIRLEDGAYQLERSELTEDGVLNSWTVIREGRTMERRFFTRLYSRKRLTAALLSAGLSPVKFWGGFDGAALTSASVRLIALARKPYGSARSRRKTRRPA